MSVEKVIINGVETKYTCDETGVIYSHFGKPMYFSTNKKGYYFLGLTVDKKRTSYSVHRIIATAHIPNPNNFPVVNHKDGNRKNNHVSNLEWCTQQRNVEHGIAIEVSLISPEGEVVHVYNLRKFSIENGLDDSAMSKVANGIRKSHKQWRKSL